MAGAVQTQTAQASDPGLALAECGCDAGLENTRVLRYCVDPPTFSPWSANFLVGGVVVGPEQE